MSFFYFFFSKNSIFFTIQNQKTAFPKNQQNSSHNSQSIHNLNKKVIKNEKTLPLKRSRIIKLIIFIFIISLKINSILFSNIKNEKLRNSGFCFRVTFQWWLRDSLKGFQ
jgi:hypothetical protein